MNARDKDGRAIIVDDEASIEIIEEVYGLYVRGWHIDIIVQHAETCKWKVRGHPISKHSVYRIIKWCRERKGLPRSRRGTKKLTKVPPELPIQLK